MSGFFLHRSHRVEQLAAELIAALHAEAPADPLSPHTVVVGNRGMERWLRVRVAEATGLCANVRFPFPGMVIAELLASLGTTPAQTPDEWGAERLAWHLLDLLPPSEDEPALAALRAYLRGEPARPAGRRAWALAHALAELLDRLMVHRPEWVLSWQAGRTPDDPLFRSGEPEEARWQRRLFELLGARLGTATVAERADAALRAAAEAPTGTLALAPVHVFGISALPRLHLALFAAAARHTSVHLYLQVPSTAFFAEYRAKRSRGSALDPAALASLEDALATQHPLVTSLGRVSRDMQLLLAERDDVQEVAAEEPSGDDAAPTSMLTLLQQDLVALRTPAERQRLGWAPSGNDDSVQLHACHGPTRQVEVLRDELWRLFARCPGLQPRDVVVMTPDIETYGPLVEATFGGRGRERADGAPPPIPVELADLGIRSTNPVADALLRVLEMAEGRLTASALGDLCSLDVVRRRFGLGERDVGKVLGWLRAVGVRWGADAEDRERHGQPPTDQNTLLFGLRRLALGVLSPNEGSPVALGGTLVDPYDDLEGEELALFGRFATLCATVCSFVTELRHARTVEGWCALVLELTTALVDVAPEAHGLLGQVREGLLELREQGAGFHRELSLAVLRRLLEGRFQQAHRGDRPVSGAVTVCALQPMRSVPFAVVALLGMDDGAFPRAAPELGFDLVRRSPRPGDRDPRDEDRHLLLEALLSARTHLLVCYTGADPHTSEERAPAVPVAELLEVLEQSCAPPEGWASLRGYVLRRHPVQPFSARAFADDRTRSFDQRMAATASSLRRPAGLRTGSLALAKTAALAPAELGELRLDELHAILRNPVRELLRKRLSVTLRDEDEGLRDREPIELDALERWQLDAELLPRQLASGTEPVDRAALEAELRAQGRLPLGPNGRLALDERLDATGQLLASVGPELGNARPSPVTLVVGATTLTGQVERVAPDGSVLRISPSAPNGARTMLLGWLELLCAQAASPKPGRRALLYGLSKGKPAKVELLAPPCPELVLTDLVAFAREALERVLPVAEKSTFALAEKLGIGEPFAARSAAALDAALRAAEQAWSSDPASERLGDDADPVLAAAFCGEPPFIVEDGSGPSSEFVACAERLWKPLLEARAAATAPPAAESRDEQAPPAPAKKRARRAKP